MAPPVPASHSLSAVVNGCKANPAVDAPSPTAYLFRSKLPDIDIPAHLPLPKYCLEHAHELADKPCLIQANAAKTYTYGEVELYMHRVASGLATIGVEKADTVMLLLPNCAEFVLVFLGAAMRGAMVTTCNPFYTQGEIEKQVKASAVKLIVTHMACREKVAGIVAEHPHVKVMVTDGQMSNNSMSTENKTYDYLPISVLLETDEAGCPEVEIDPDDVVALPYSSGTTGQPKGVMLTHKGLVTGVAQHVDGENPSLYIKADDVVLCVLPMFHILSLTMVLASLRKGARIAIMEKFELRGLLEVVERERVTVAPLVPPILMALTQTSLLAHFDLSSIRFLIFGAAPLGKHLEDALRARVPHAIIAQGYGMTEAGSALSMSLAFAKYPQRVKSGSCGTVIRNAVVKIVDPKTGASLRHNQPGEICIKGPQLMKGYINDIDSTKHIIDEEGFLHSGDIGIFDDNEELFIVDRIKEIIKFKGFQISPRELEGILLNHPQIADAACVAEKDEAVGELPVAFVVLVKGAHIHEDEIKEFVSKQVVFYKKLHKVFLVNQIPKSPSGKILRKELRTCANALSLL